MLVQRRKRWPSIEPGLVQRLANPALPVCHPREELTLPCWLIGLLQADRLVGWLVLLMAAL